MHNFQAFYDQHQIVTQGFRSKSNKMQYGLIYERSSIVMRMNCFYQKEDNEKASGRKPQKGCLK